MKKKKVLLELFSLFFITALFLAVYVLLEMRGDILAVLGSAVVLVIASYLFIDVMIEYKNDLVTRKSEDSTDVTHKQTPDSEEVMNVLKAIYTATKRNGVENSNILNQIETGQQELLQEIRRLAGMLEETSGGSNAERRMLQTEQSILDILKVYRQEQQAGIKSIIKFNKENAKQIAENEHTNTEMLLVELRTMLETVLSGISVMDGQTLNHLPQEARIQIEAEAEPEVLVPEAEAEPEVQVSEPEQEQEVPELEQEPEIPVPEVETEPEQEPEVPMPEVETEPEQELEIPEAAGAEENAPEEIPDALQQLMSDDPNKALTPDEIAAMFAAAGQ